MYLPAMLFILFYSSAMVALWCTPRRDRLVLVPWSLFALSLTIPLIQGWLQPLGLLWVLLLIAMTSLFQRVEHRMGSYLLLPVLIVVVLALATHLLPGFHPIPVYGEQSYRNLDKACVAFVLLAMLVPKIRRWKALRNALSATWPLFVVAPLVIFSLAYLLDAIGAGGRPSHRLWLWAWGNLLVTSVAEELFFRGLLQHYLAQKWRAIRWGWLAALGLVSILFGLVHLGGGAEFALLATIAGLFYGLAYHLSGRIEMAILLHFFINLVHLWLRG